MGQQLKPDSTYIDFKSLFTTFGTHYISQAGIGAKVTFFAEGTSSFAKSASYSDITSCMDKQFQATFQAKGLAIGPISSPSGSASTGFGSCQGAQSSHTSMDFEKSMRVEFKVSGGDYRYFTPCLPAGSTPWDTFAEKITLDNSEIMITALKPIWDLFHLIRNDSNLAVTQNLAEKFFYQFLVTEGESFEDRAMDSDTSVSFSPKLGAATFVVIVAVMMVL